MIKNKNSFKRRWNIKRLYCSRNTRYSEMKRNNSLQDIFFYFFSMTFPFCAQQLECFSIFRELKCSSAGMFFIYLFAVDDKKRETKSLCSPTFRTQSKEILYWLRTTEKEADWVTSERNFCENQIYSYPVTGGQISTTQPVRSKRQSFRKTSQFNTTQKLFSRETPGFWVVVLFQHISADSCVLIYFYDHRIDKNSQQKNCFLTGIPRNRCCFSRALTFHYHETSRSVSHQKWSEFNGIWWEHGSATSAYTFISHFSLTFLMSLNIS